MLDVTFPSQGFNGPEYHHAVVKADVREQGGFSFIHSIYIEVQHVCVCESIYPDPSLKRYAGYHNYISLYVHVECTTS